jgi:hypothetical protein
MRRLRRSGADRVGREDNSEGTGSSVCTLSTRLACIGQAAMSLSQCSASSVHCLPLGGASGRGMHLNTGLRCQPLLYRRIIGSAQVKKKMILCLGNAWRRWPSRTGRTCRPPDPSTPGWPVWCKSCRGVFSPASGIRPPGKVDQKIPARAAGRLLKLRLGKRPRTGAKTHRSEPFHTAAPPILVDRHGRGPAEAGIVALQCLQHFGARQE